MQKVPLEGCNNLSFIIRIIKFFYFEQKHSASVLDCKSNLP
jgi:hypothetical protein